MADSRFLVIHGDDLGLTHSFNAGIREACAGGLLSSTSVRSNGAAFEEAVDQVIPACPDLGVGIHLNVVEGRTQRSSLGRSSRICDSQGYYKVSFGGLLWAHRNRDDTTFAEIQDDFRTQIEAVLARGIAPDHLSSHQHSHAVPSGFRIVCELAREYGIPFVRLVREAFYWAGSVRSHLPRHLVSGQPAETRAAQSVRGREPSDRREPGRQDEPLLRRARVHRSHEHRATHPRSCPALAAGIWHGRGSAASMSRRFDLPGGVYRPLSRRIYPQQGARSRV